MIALNASGRWGCIRDASVCIRDALGMHGGDSKDALRPVDCRNAFELFVYIGNGVRGSLRGLQWRQEDREDREDLEEDRGGRMH